MAILRAIIDYAEKSQQGYNVPSSVSLGQFGLESSWGRFLSAPFNPFGIKEFKDKSKQRWVATREVYNGKSVIVQQPFRIFANYGEAFDFHAKLLATNKVYAAAMEAWTKPPYSLRVGVVLMAARYATAPDYATVLMNIINTSHLEQYDREAEALRAKVARITPTVAMAAIPHPENVPLCAACEAPTKLHPLVAALEPAHTLSMAA